VLAESLNGSIEATMDRGNIGSVERLHAFAKAILDQMG
jgi:hypothetical protein